MTAQRLIEELSKMPPDLPVMQKDGGLFYEFIRVRLADDYDPTGEKRVIVLDAYDQEATP